MAICSYYNVNVWYIQHPSNDVTVYNTQSKNKKHSPGAGHHQEHGACRVCSTLKTGKRETKKKQILEPLVLIVDSLSMLVLCLLTHDKVVQEGRPWIEKMPA